MIRNSKQIRMTEIQLLFDSKWVLIKDPQTNEVLEIMGGEVCHHSKDREEVYRMSIR